MKRSISAADDEPAAPALTGADFARLIAPLAPFEPAPHLAVAVSGGADSLALTLLAHDWARPRGGRITALTVDHRLRPGSTEEALRVGEWLAARGIAHEILTWQGPYPLHDLQAAARAARYCLLADWCRAASVLHLLTAHHLDDQAETLVLRLARGSGAAGLAGMAAVSELPACRLLRPLLTVPSQRLRATLATVGQSWIEDPSNRNERFARVKIRAGRAALDALGLTGERLADAAMHLGRARAVLETETDALLARAAMVHPAGFVRADPALLAAAPDEIRLRALAAILATVGGGAYTPRFERLERLDAALRGGSLAGGRTLGGCRIVAAQGGLLVYREPAAVAPPLSLEPGVEALWDGRFRVTWPDEASSLRGLRIGAVPAGDEIAPFAIAARAATHHLPRRVWLSLPSIWQGDRLISLPFLVAPDRHGMPAVRFRPARTLGSGMFRVVRGSSAG